MLILLSCTLLLLTATGCESTTRGEVLALPVYIQPASKVDPTASPVTYESDPSATLVIASDGTNPAGAADFQVLAGTSPFTGATSAAGTVDVGGTGMAMVQSGFAYLAGDRPYGGTSGGSGIEPGSGFIVAKSYQRSNGTTADRFIYVLKDSASGLRVTDSAGTTHILPNPFDYVDIVSGTFHGGVQSAPKAFDGTLDKTAPVVQFINEVLLRAQDAGLPAPATW
jgi:hypothetical protein